MSASSYLTAVFDVFINVLSFCFRQELSNSFTSAYIHAREQTYGKSTSTLLALGAVPSSATSGSRTLFTGVPEKYRKHQGQTLYNLFVDDKQA